MRSYVSFVLLALVTALLVPISAGAQADAFCTAVFDANGTRVNGAVQSDDVTTLLIDRGDLVARLNVTLDALEGATSVYYTGPNCTGDPYLEVRGVLPLAQKTPTSDEVSYADYLVPWVLLDPESQRTGSGACVNAGGPYAVYPALSFTLPSYTPPFHLEPEACYTPDPTVAALTPYSLGAMALMLVFGAYVMKKRHSATVDID